MTVPCTHTASGASCPCTYEPCSRKGKCCACIAYHRSSDELPACYFSPAAERTYDRSVGKFMETKNA